MKIDVLVKHQYGKTNFYPLSEDAKILCKLTGKPTLTKSQLVICLNVGWSVSIETTKYTLEEILESK